jgi:SAM-dependent methyltransferase
LTELDRLYPKKNSSRYFILSELRKAYISAIGKYLSPEHHIKLVDFGCGEMPYKVLFGNNVEYIGYDLPGNPKAIKNLSDQNLTYEPDASIHVVLSSQVLEHVEDTKAYLLEIARILKKDGILLLSTHGIWMYHPNPKDLWRWTHDGLMKLLIENKFDIVDIYSIGDLTSSGLQLFQDGIRNRIPSKLRSSFFFLIQYLQYFLYKPANNADGCVYLIIAKKSNG